MDITLTAGYHRAGVTHDSTELSQLVSQISNDGDSADCMTLQGLYSHAGHSYGASSADEAISMLVNEIKKLQLAAARIRDLCTNTKHQPLVLSVGATPTATSVENIGHFPNRASDSRHADALSQCIQEITASDDVLELHAGVYSFLDMQQLATQASPSGSATDARSPISTADIALTVLAEVASLYTTRNEPEALITTGSLALGREPCKSYDGWGVVSNWGFKSGPTALRSGWQVGRISQEHGILTCDPSVQNAPQHLWVGQEVRVFPNHACIAGAGFGWYLVVDSSRSDEERDEIIDVWVRCRGW